MTQLLRTIALLLALSAAGAAAADDRTDWDGLARVNSRNFDGVFLAPGADFSGYTKVMIDPTEVAFQRDWLRDYNFRQMGQGGGRRISDADARSALELMQSGFQEEFRAAYVAAGYQIVTEPAPDVLRLRTAVLDIRVSAPDQLDAGRTRSFANETGQATLMIEARDSMSNALLGRAVDGRLAGDNSVVLWRNRASNRADFRRLFHA